MTEAEQPILQELDPALTAAISAHLREGRLPCAAAFTVARSHRTTPRRVATVTEAMGIRIGWCQLGLFGEHRKGRPDTAQEVSAELRAQIEAALKEDRLPCARAWAIARRLNLERIEVGRAANTLGVRISRCQLGCFP